MLNGGWKIFGVEVWVLGEERGHVVADCVICNGVAEVGVEGFDVGYTNVFGGTFTSGVDEGFAAGEGGEVAGFAWGEVEFAGHVGAVGSAGEEVDEFGAGEIDGGGGDAVRVLVDDPAADAVAAGFGHKVDNFVDGIGAR